MVDAEIEVDRYTIWPGQALSYKMGQREIERARADVGQRLGDGLRPPRVPRRGARTRLAAARDAPAGDSRLGGGGGRPSGAPPALSSCSGPERIVLEGASSGSSPSRSGIATTLLAAATEAGSIWAFMGSNLSDPATWPAYLAAALSRSSWRGPRWSRRPVRRWAPPASGTLPPEHDRVEIGWTWLAPSRHRTAVNTEAKLLQLTYAFDTLGAGRVALKTDGRNERSQRAIERLGAVREGVLGATRACPMATSATRSTTRSWPTSGPR